MKRLRHLLLASALSLVFAAAASAVPVDFTFLSTTTTGGAFPTTQTFLPALPLLGSGNIDFASGTGTLTLPDYSIIIDVGVSPADAQLDISNWSQTITSIDASGNIISTCGGSVVCTDLGGLGSFICPGVSPTVSGWPTAGPALSSAVLDPILQRITVRDSSDANAGNITTVYGYTIVPEPGTALLMGGGLMALAMGRKRRLSCDAGRGNRGGCPRRERKADSLLVSTSKLVK